MSQDIKLKKKQYIQKHQNQSNLIKKIFKILSVFLLAIVFFMIARIYATQSIFSNTGSISDCCGNVQQLRRINQKIAQPLSKLVKTKFFRTFKVDIMGQCPLWAQNKICKFAGCSLCLCNQKDIPMNWKKEQAREQDKLKDEKNPFPKDQSCQGMVYWHTMQQEKARQNAKYLDLDSNKQSFTGYDGSTVWKLIYEQNCFRGDDICREQQALYRLISGLHTSITIQLSENYRPKNDFLSSFKPNLTLFLQRLQNKLQYGQNLYFTYATMIRALQIYLPQINSTKFQTNHKSDSEATHLINTILTMPQLQYPVFQEQKFFGLKATSLKKDYRKYIHNISRLLDCVGCQKCKVYGKLQFYGIASTIKALLGQRSSLDRNQLIAFINTINKLSSSIIAVDMMTIRLRDKRIFQAKIISLACIIILAFLRLMIYMFDILPEKARKLFKKMPNIKIE